MVDQGAMQLEVSQCPSWAACLGYGGVAAAVCLSNWGSAVRYVASCWLLAYYYYYILCPMIYCVYYRVQVLLSGCLELALPLECGAYLSCP